MLFDNIYYINLDRRPDRKEHVEKSLEYLDLLNITTRIDAVDGNKIIPDEISKKLITQEGLSDAYDKEGELYAPLTIGGIGCALSHRNTYKKIIFNNIQKCLILEDDAKLNADFLKILEEVEQNIPTDFDMLFLGYHVAYIEENVNNYCFIPDRVYGLFGYIVSLEGAKKLLDIFPISQQIDTVISENMNKFKAYCLNIQFHVIFSDRSSVTTQFGTDIQIREHFDIDFSSGSMDGILNYVILFLLIYIILILIFRIIKKNKCVN